MATPVPVRAEVLGGIIGSGQVFSVQLPALLVILSVFAGQICQQVQ